ncbi:Zinc Finger Protein Zfpm2 [Manis pentadactyla]|nr:Zinc Finger Protein Zfpm2 [Manis pentadactyla]
MMPWAAPPPASCAPQKTTARAVVVLSSLAPYDAVGGTDDGIGPNCKADDDLKGPPPPQGKGTTPALRRQTRHRAAQALAQRLTLTLKTSRCDTTHPSMAIIFRSTPAPHEAVGSSTACLLHTSATQCVGSHPPDYPEPTRCRGRHRRRPRTYLMHNKPWASPPLASCASQIPTAQAVNVWSPMDPQDAVGGTDDGLGPTPKSDDDQMGTP